MTIGKPKEQPTHKKLPEEIEDIERQDFKDVDGENIFGGSTAALEKASVSLAAGAGNLELGFDALGMEYAKFRFRDFTFYTINPREVDQLKSVLENREKSN